jgi:hypothetical protein
MKSYPPTLSILRNDIASGGEFEVANSRATCCSMTSVATILYELLFIDREVNFKPVGQHKK